MQVLADVSPDALIESLTLDTAFDLVVEIDRGMQDYEFTERLAKHFLAELVKESEAAGGEPLDIQALLPKPASSRKKQAKA